VARSAVLLVLLAVTLLVCGCSQVSTTHIRTRTTSTVASATTQATSTKPGAASSTNAPPAGTLAVTMRQGGSARRTSSAAATQPSQGQTAWEAAVQTVLNYYGDINQRKYKEAYCTWAGDGAASGQSFKQFKQGYASTVQVSILIGPSRARNTAPVKVPVGLISVVNRSGGAPQAVQQYRGSYTVRHTAKGWRISHASIASSSGKLPPAEFAAPGRLIRAYYLEINRRHFARAYTFWEDLGQASNQSFARFERGFVRSEHDAVEVGRPGVQGAAGSLFANVPVVIVATNKDQSKQTFRGSYILRRSDVAPFEKLGWRIYRAKIAEQ
jgi:hypothetical protein